MARRRQSKYNASRRFRKSRRYRRNHTSRRGGSMFLDIAAPAALFAASRFASRKYRGKNSI